ncbi:MAG: hypothetical protein JWP01_338 [Myxococcales bacterium]|nr:hypothetical protein [Myxococcales bacterium]
MRHRLLLVGVLLFGGCYKAERGTGATTAPSNTARAGVDYSATLADPIGFLPIDSEVVVSLDAEQLRGSEIWRMLEPKLWASMGSSLAAFKVECGFDPVATVRGITIAAKGLKQDKPDAVVVVSGIDRARLTECMTRTSKTGEKGIAIDKDGVITMGNPQDGRVALAFVDASTVVAQVGALASHDGLFAILKSGAPLRKSPAFVELIGQVNLEASLWTVVNGNSSLFEQAASLGVKPKAIFGSVGLTKGLDASLRFRLSTPQEAQSITTMAQGQLSMAVNFFEKLEITQDNADVVVIAVMTEAQLQNVVSLLGGMMGSAGTP